MWGKSECVWDAAESALNYRTALYTCTSSNSWTSAGQSRGDPDKSGHCLSQTLLTVAAGSG